MTYLYPKKDRLTNSIKVGKCENLEERAYVDRDPYMLFCGSVDHVFGDQSSWIDITMRSEFKI